MNHITSRISVLRLVSVTPLVLLPLLAAFACTERVIGEAGSGGAPAGTGGAGTGGLVNTSTGGSEACDEGDQSPRLAYDTWRAAENTVGALAGMTFEGYVRGGPDLTLSFAESGSGTLVVGEAAPPATDPDAGYLCTWDDADCREGTLKPGGTYAIHGAHFENNRLRFEFAENAALDSWCGLQTPHLRDDCFYSPFTDGRITFPGGPGAGSCTIDLEPVDCNWFLPLFENGVCQCTSEGCFPATAAPGSNNTMFDATYDPDDGRLEGSVGDADFFLKETCDGAGGVGGAGGAGTGCGD